MFHFTATKEVPEDQERHHGGAVLHPGMAGVFPVTVALSGGGP